jgi:MoxR-vWA-beta-propeller ternary system domain bpX5
MGGRSLIGVTWEICEPPLRPVGVLARGRAAQTLARMIADRLCVGKGGLAHDLRVSISSGLVSVEPELWIVILGPEEQLPWVDSATYLGADGPLLRPTTLRSNPPGFVLKRAIDRERENLQEEAKSSIVICMPGLVLMVSAQTGPPQVPVLRAFAHSSAPVVSLAQP